MQRVRRGVGRAAVGRGVHVNGRVAWYHRSAAQIEPDTTRRHFHDQAHVCRLMTRALVTYSTCPMLPNAAPFVDRGKYRCLSALSLSHRLALAPSTADALRGDALHTARLGFCPRILRMMLRRATLSHSCK
mmetsp:Transcript_28896/g.65474  ORF Transcript_28896/g.65474 Transcript_28896/m.65474 type:complete len:131 (-) Transcript_28896:1277-1669(-)